MMRVRSLFPLALILFAACSGGGSGKAQLAKAEEQLSSGDYNTAVVTLSNLVSKDPGNSRAQILLARGQLLRGELRAAQVALDASSESREQVADVRAQLALAEGAAEALLTDIGAGKYELPAQRADYYRGRALQEMGSVAAALAIYEQLLASGNASEDLHVHAAECHAALGRQSLARSHLDQALALNARSAAAWRLKAILVREQNRQESLQALAKAIESAPGQLSTGERLALLTTQLTESLSEGQGDAAAAAQAAMVKLAAQSPVTQWASAQVAMSRGDTSGAVATLQRLTQQAGDFPPARPALIAALLADGSPELAMKELAGMLGAGPVQTRGKLLQEVLRRTAATPRDSEERVLRSLAALEALEQPVASRALLTRSLSQWPDSLPLQDAAVRLELRMGRNAQALAKAQELSDRHPGDLRLSRLLADSLAASGDHDRAASIYQSLWSKGPLAPLAVGLALARIQAKAPDSRAPLETWLASYPADIAARLVLADLSMNLRDLDRARREYEAILAKQPDNVVALNNLAHLSLQAGNPSRALPYARRAHELAASSAQVADSYGWSLAEQGDLKQAVPLLRQAVRSDPSDPEMRYHLGAALARTGLDKDRDEARVWLQDLRRHEPDFARAAEIQPILDRLK